MKWHSVVTTTALSAASLAGTVGATSSTCSTYYGTQATTKIPTKTITTTETVSYATGVTTYTRTTTEPVYTFTSTIARTTTTIPVGPSFTPIISAGNLPGVTKKPSHGRRAALTPRAPNPKNAKALREAAAESGPPTIGTTPSASNTHWPQSVVCTKTTTTTKYLASAYSTVVRSATTARYATATTHVATATVHAACQGPSNVVTHFGGAALEGINYNLHYQICSFETGDSSPSGAHSGSYACMDARACCEIAQDYFSGWRFDNATGYNRCVVMRGNDVGYSGGWVFYDGENDGEYFFGNGASWGGVYGGKNPDPQCLNGEGCEV